MLKNRVISTLKFFDLQNTPLTLLELHRFLLADLMGLKDHLDGNWELVNNNYHYNYDRVEVGEILQCLDNECCGEVESKQGFYALKGRVCIIDQRLENYQYGIKREKLIKKFIPGLRHLPFIRGVALAGSQAMGLQKQTSDIDLLIITDSRFMWLSRTLTTAYFQLTGKRRRHNKIANRFCLNHYLSRPKEVDRERNLYKAMEYVKLRSLLNPKVTTEFQKNNFSWIKFFFPQAQFENSRSEPQSYLARFVERLFNNRFGLGLERSLGNWELKRIQQGKYVFITAEELSFHPESKHQQLLDNFFSIEPIQVGAQNPSR